MQLSLHPTTTFTTAAKAVASRAAFAAVTAFVSLPLAWWGLQLLEGLVHCVIQF